MLVRQVKEETGKDGSVLSQAFSGGKQRFDEIRSECLKREILVETGYDVYSVKEISLRYYLQFPDAIVYHFCRLSSPKAVVQPSEPYEVVEIR